MKCKLYPKTKRVGSQKAKVTEKLDGSNIGFFRLNDELIIAQRNNVFTMTEAINLSKKDDLYKGMREFLFNKGVKLRDRLYEGSGFFAEWIGMGRLKYDLKNRINIFAKANIKFTSDKTLGLTYEVHNIYYNPDLFVYPFLEQKIPDFISIVPIVKELDAVSVEILDELYDEYSKEVDRNVEGFIVIYNNESIQKYVRMKSGTLEKHFW